MASFNPDAYLAEKDTEAKQPAPAFNPDAYLAEPETMGGGESAFRGAIDSLSYGLGDEIGGHMEALASKVGLRGVGSPNLLDIRLETDKEDEQSYSDVQEAMRDRRRGLDKQAAADNPGAFLGGQITGGVVGAIAPVGALKLAAQAPKLAKGAQALARATQGSTAARTAAKVGAVEGAVYGFGSSEAEDPTQLAADTLKGGAFGAGGGLVVGKGLEKISDFATAASDIPGKVSALAQKFLPDVTAMKRGFEEGAKEKTISEGLVANVEKVYKGVKGALTEGRASKELQSEISDQVTEAKRLLNKKMLDLPEGQLSKQEIIVANKSIRDMGDEEAILAALLEDGPNPVKKWIAQKAATENPGNMPASQYEEILNMSAAVRDTAKEFDPSQVGRELKPLVKDVHESFIEGRGQAYGDLQTDAGIAYVKKYTEPLIDVLDEGIRRGRDRSSVISSKVPNVMEEVKRIILEAPDYADKGLTPGPLVQASKIEHFKRLQLARELIDDSISFDANKGRMSGDNLLMGVRSQIDEALKTSPMKNQVDELWAASKDVESNFFGAIKFGKGAGISIDEFKIAKMLNDTDSGGRFRNAVDSFQEFINRPELNNELRGKAQKLITKLKENFKIAEDKRALASFRWTPGPSSPAVQRLQSVMGGQKTLVEEAVQSPTGFVTMMDEFRKEITERAGKKLDDFDEKERAALAKLWVLRKNSPDMSQAKFEEHYKMLFPNASRQGAIDKFLD